MGAVESRSLAWDGCFNVRDLGGLETASGGRTRRGAVVRADNVRRLTVAGWQAALDHGVRRLVDLRFEGERQDDPSPPDGVEVIGVSLFGRHDPDAETRIAERLLGSEDAAAVHAGFYTRTLAQRPETVAAAVAAVADADDEDGVLIHCFAGKDRTGIVAALLLSVAGVPDEIVAADYAESGPNMSALFDGWIAAAGDDEQRELRRRLALAERETMLAVLDWLSDNSGGAAAYLGEAGLTGGQLALLRARLVER